MQSRFGWIGLLLGIQLLVVGGIRAQSADASVTTSPAAPGTHLALIATSKLEGSSLRTAKDGIILIWLLEPGGVAFPPGFGGIRLSFDGVQYNSITSPMSATPLAPTLVMHDGPAFARQHPEIFTKRGPPSADSLVAEFRVRGDKPLPGTQGKVGIELGIWPPGQDAGSGSPRWTWYDFPFTP